MNACRIPIWTGITALVMVVAVAGCGTGSTGTANGPAPTTAPAVTAAAAPTTATDATPPTVSGAPGDGGDAWCQSIVAMTDFMTEADSLRALAGTPVPDGAARSQQLRTLVADMQAKAPGGHDADWVILNQVYDQWEQQLAAPTKDRLTDLQTLTTSDEMKAAQANLHDDIVKACPNVKGLGM